MLDPLNDPLQLFAPQIFGIFEMTQMEIHGEQTRTPNADFSELSDPFAVAWIVRATSK